VAGPLSKDGVVKYIQYMHEMCRIATILMAKGHHVFVPALDFLLGFIAGQFTEQDYKNLSLAWLKRCDAIFIIPNSEGSPGVAKELEVAEELDLYIFRSFLDVPDPSWCTESWDYDAALERTRASKRKEAAT
jgi:hypothetical protein